MTKYLVCKVEYEYNDETYNRPECGAVNPKFVFDTPEAANKRCLELNLQWINGLVADENNRWDCGFADYTYDVGDLFTAGHIPYNLLDRHFPDYDKSADWGERHKFMKRLPAAIVAMPVEDQIEVIEALCVIGWEVREVEEG